MKLLNLKGFSGFMVVMQHLFVYGSLLFPELVEKLTGKYFVSVPAVLDGYKRFTVKGCDYPAIIHNKKSNVEGRLILNVDNMSLKILTFFEGDEYEKETVWVLTGTKKMEALAFIWRNDLLYLEDFDWNKDSFRESSLSLYLEKIAQETKDEFKSSNF